MRNTFPQMNSSSMRSPITRMRFSENPVAMACKRVASISGRMRGHGLRSLLNDRRVSAIHGPRCVARHRDQRKRPPGQNGVDAAPEPDRLIEDFEDHLADVCRPEHLAVGP